MRNILFIVSVGFLLLPSCKNDEKSLPISTSNSLLENKIDGAITISADGMSKHPDTHTIKVSSSFLDDSKKEKGAPNMRIGEMTIPLNEKKDENFEMLSSKDDTYSSAKRMFGDKISFNAILSLTNKNSRVASSKDFYSPKVLNIDISSNEGANILEFNTDKDFVIKWNVDNQNTNPIVFAVSCDPNEKGEFAKKLITISKQVNDADGKVIFSKEDFVNFPKGKKVFITGGRGNKEDMLIDGKNIRVTSYSTSVDLSLVSK